jgi:SAM-dependent methyltransferase
MHYGVYILGAVMCPVLVVVPVLLLALVTALLRGRLDDPKTLEQDLGVIESIYDYNALMPQNDFTLGDVMRYFKATTDLDYWLLEWCVGPGLHTVLSPRPPGKRSNARQCEFVMREIRGKVLEVGCGRGYCSLYLAGCFPETLFVGVDVVDRHVEVATQAAKDGGYRNVEFRQQDILEGGGGGEKYGLIFGVESLCYMDSTEKRQGFMLKSAASLKQRGCVVIVDGFRTASFDTRPVDVQVAMCLAERGFRIQSMPSKDDWINAAMLSGLCLVKDIDLTEEALPFWTLGWRLARSILYTFPYFVRWLISAKPETAANLLAVATTAFAMRGGAAEYGVLVFRKK